MTAATSIVKADTTTLAMIERVAALLVEVKGRLPSETDMGKLLELRAQADAMRVFLQQRNAAETAQLDAAEIKRRTEWRLGQLTKALEPMPQTLSGAIGAAAQGKQGAPVAGAPSKKAVLAEMGIPQQRASEWERLGTLDGAALDANVTALRTKLVTVTGAKAAVFSSDSDEWYTPDKYLVSARKLLGGFDLDPASCEKANAMVRAKRIYTIDDDGLRKPWNGSVWCNPPYGDEGGGMAAWISKMAEEHDAERMTQGIMLVNATTEAGWFQPLWNYALCFTDHRIKFYTPSGTPRSPVSGNAFVYFGRDIKAFANAFAVHGAVVRRVK